MNNLYLLMEEELNSIEENNQVNKALQAINICQKYLEKLKKSLKENPPKTKEEEIRFFKFTKPKFQAKLFFHQKWYNIQIRKIAFDNGTLIKYYQKECQKLKRFAKETIDFQTYLHSGQTHFDEKFFTRNNNDLTIYVEPLYAVLDHSFSTTHDYLTAQLMANDMLRKCLQTEITKLSNQNKNIQSQYKWTDKKIDLVELIYAIYTSNSINRGNIEISEIAEIFSEVFNEDLGNIYRTYAEIKNRKNPTRYLDHLKDKLLEKIDDELGN